MNEEENARRIMELTARVSELERWVQELLRREKIYVNLAGGSGMATDENDSIWGPPQELPGMEAVRQALLEGAKIKAIKIYRETFGVGLREAKDAVDAME